MNERTVRSWAAMLIVGTVVPAGAQTGVREVAASERGVISLQTRLRYTR